jgi:pimeloyl-ACP methyl ester carboxylesterase
MESTVDRESTMNRITRIAPRGGNARAAKSAPTCCSWSWERCYQRGLQRCYTQLSLQEKELPGDSGAERLAYFDSVSPPSPEDSGTPILLLHGFTADKESWFRMVRYMGGRHRLIGVDLAGHGRSPEAVNGKYCRVAQANRVQRVAEELELERYHLLGHSMGGAVAVTHAAEHPEEVLSLGLIAPAGLDDPHTAEFHRYAAGEIKPPPDINPIIIADNWNFNEKLRYVTNGPRWFHFVMRFFNKYLTQRDLPREQLYQEIFRQLTKEKALSDKELGKIVQPTFILWGKEDRVLKPSCADEFEARILGECVVKKWDGVGHTVNIEKPRKTAMAYLAFLKDLGKTVPGQSAPSTS